MNLMKPLGCDKKIGICFRTTLACVLAISNVVPLLGSCGATVDARKQDEGHPAAQVVANAETSRGNSQDICSNSRNTRQEDSPDPVQLIEGNVKEEVTDASLPGPGTGWAHIRTYNSRLFSSTADPMASIQGERWEVMWMTSRIIWQTGSNDLDYYVTASQVNTIKWDSAAGKYQVPEDWFAECNWYKNDAGTTGTASGGDADGLSVSGAPFVSGELVGCLIRFTSGNNTDETRIITGNTTSGISWGVSLASSVAAGDGFEILDRVVIHWTNTHEKREFAGNNPNWDAGESGLLRRRLDAYGSELTFSYDAQQPGGRISSITTTQGWEIRYYYRTGSFDLNRGRIDHFDVRNGSGQVLQRVRYYYHGSDGYTGSHLGSTGDLIMVRSLQRADGDDLTSALDADFSIVKTTQYRYCISGFERTSPSNEDWGGVHQLKTILEAEDVEEIIQNNTDISDGFDILTKSDAATLAGGQCVEYYSSRRFTYYVDNTTDTGSALTTPWYGANENLQAKYGHSLSGSSNASDLKEVGVNGDEPGYVKTQTIDTYCGGANSGYDGLRRGILRHFYYFDINASVQNPGFDDVSRIVIEDVTTKDESDSTICVGRTVFGLNADGVMLRKVFLDSKTNTRHWCESKVYGTTGGAARRLVERRLASAHTVVNTDAEISQFLDPTYTDAIHDNDADTLNGSSDPAGVVLCMDHNDDGYVTAFKKRNTKTNTTYYIAASDYGDGTTVPANRKTQDYIYPEPETFRTASSRVEVSYAYTFYSGSGDTQLETRTITLPAVSTAEHGTGSSVTIKEYYDQKGRMRWQKDGRGAVHYTSYDPDLSLPAFHVRDVDTSANLSTEIQSNGGGEWVAWSSSTPPSGFTRGSSLPSAVELTRKMSYDDLGRLKKAVDPSGLITWLVHKPFEVRVYPAWQSDGKPDLAVRIMKVNHSGRVVERSAFDADATGVSIGSTGSPSYPTGSDTVPTAAWTAKTVSQYDVESNLTSVDEYFDIENNLKRTTQYTYERGRLQYITRPDGSIVFYQYDPLGRVVGQFVGTDAEGATQDNPAGSGQNNLEQTVALIYDDGGVGDGHLTQGIRYWDKDDATNKVVVKYRHDWEGNLRGIELPAAPHVVYDVDNLGRVVATAEYSSTSNFGTDWVTVLSRPEYAQGLDASGSPFTDANRLTLSKSLRDPLGRVYRREVYAVNSSGVAGNAAATDFYFGGDSQLIAIEGLGRGGREYGYDGAGRVTEVRSVTSLSFSSGIFQYRSPSPGAATGGDDGVLSLARYTYDDAGNVSGVVRIRAVHDETTTGIDLTNDDDYIQSASYFWYNSANRLEVASRFGTGRTTAPYWAYNSSLARPATKPTASESTSGLITLYTYDAMGRPRSVTDPKGYISEVEYDDLGRSIKAIEAKNQSGVERHTLYQYDLLSNLTKMILDVDLDDTYSTSTGQWVTDNDDQVTEYTFGHDYLPGAVTRVKYPDGDDTSDNVSLTYWLDGRPDTRTDQRGVALKNHYDSMRRLTGQQFSNAASFSSSTTVDDSIKWIQRSYDSKGRVATVTSYNDGGSTPTSVANQVVYEYTDYGTLSKEYQDHGGSKNASTPYVGYSYDTAAPNSVYTKALRNTAIRYPNGREVHRLYADAGDVSGAADSISRLTAISSASTRGTNDANVLASYLRLGDGMLAKTTMPEPDFSLDRVSDHSGSAPSSGQYEGFDRYGRALNQVWYSDGSSSVIDAYGHAFDNNGNVRARANLVAPTANNLDEFHTYDALDRLVTTNRGDLAADLGSLSSSSGLEETWTLDAAGNWSTYTRDDTNDGSDELTQTRYHNTANEIAGNSGNPITETSGQPVWANPTFDAAGNMISAPIAGDETIRQIYVYDAWNRLVRIYKDRNSNGSADADVDELHQTNFYDGLHRRIQRSVREQWPSTGSNGTWDHYDYYYNASWQIVEERQTDSIAHGYHEGEVATNVYAQYVWDARYIDSPILRDRNADGNGSTGDYGLEGNAATSGLEERLYYTNDANYNVTALVNTSGSVVERYVYNAYGKATVLDGSYAAQTTDYANPIRFAGYVQDLSEADTIGLYHVRNRTYHPTLGRWNQRDPIGYVDGPSLYEYCAGNPVTRTDPSGLWFNDWHPTSIIRIKQNGQWGKLIFEQKEWGSVFDTRMSAIANNQREQRKRFVPDPVQPTLEVERCMRAETLFEDNSVLENAQKHLKYLPSGAGVSLTVNIPLGTGGVSKWGVNMHIDLDGKGNTGLYGITGAGYGRPGGGGSFYTSWGDNNGAWGGDFVEFTGVLPKGVGGTGFVSPNHKGGGISVGTPGVTFTYDRYHPLLGGRDDGE